MISLLALLFISGVYAQCPAGWSSSDRDGIIAVHNNLRSSIAKGTYVAQDVTKPTASDMTAMVYDCEIEAQAQGYVDGCPTGHSGTDGVGENLYRTFSTAPLTITGKGAAASSSWASEFQHYGWASNNLTKELFGSGIGHATQMAWAATNKVGCGVKLCPSIKANYKYMVFVVCQYAKRGNVINKNIYKSGPTCSACPTGSTCNTGSGLCE